MKGILKIGGLIVMTMVLTACGGGKTTPTAQPQSLVAPLPTQTLESTSIPTSTLTPTPVVLGQICGVNCIWSKACVDQGYTLPEQNGLTRVKPDSCIPLDTNYWNIRSSDPFAGMPCAKGSTMCVWSRQCVTLNRVPAILNGLAPVIPGSSCQPATP